MVSPEAILASLIEIENFREWATVEGLLEATIKIKGARDKLATSVGIDSARESRGQPPQKERSESQPNSFDSGKYTIPSWAALSALA
jgi:hypothetical protein